MKHLVPVWTGVALFLLSVVRATAWSSAGHQVIAAEAYRQLPPALKAKANEILKAHPDYEKWKASSSSGSTVTLFYGPALSIDYTFTRRQMNEKHKRTTAFKDF